MVTCTFGLLTQVCLFFFWLFISAKTFMSDMFFQVIEYYPNFRIHNIFKNQIGKLKLKKQQNNTTKRKLLNDDVQV